jgi:uncharacterized protein (DUF58 family)
MTKFGLFLLFLLSQFYLVTLQSQTGLLFLLIGLLLGCCFVNYLGARRSVQGIDLAELRSLKLIEKIPAKVPVGIRNRLRQVIGAVSVSSPYGNVFRTPALEGGGEAHIAPSVSIPVRGAYPLSTLTLSSSFPFGLVRATRRIALEGEWLVLPAVYPAPCPPVSGYEPVVGGSFRGSHRVSGGNDFAGVRCYQPGDPVRSIHWRTSSKGQGLMVREYHEELAGRVAILLDCTASDEMPGSETELDRGVRAAGSLAVSALAEDHNVELAELGSLRVWRQPPFLEGDFLLECLARVTPIGEECLTRDRIRATLALVSRRASICLVIVHVPPDLPEIIDELRADGRLVSLAVPERLSDTFGAAVDFPLFRYFPDRIERS